MNSANLGRFVGPKPVLVAALLLTLLAAGIALGSYYFPSEIMTARRGQLSFIPREYRLQFVEYRLLGGVGSASVFVVIATGWLGTGGFVGSGMTRV